MKYFVFSAFIVACFVVIITGSENSTIAEQNYAKAQTINTYFRECTRGCKSLAREQKVDCILNCTERHRLPKLKNQTEIVNGTAEINGIILQ